MYVEMIESRTIGGKLRQPGEKINLADDKAAFLIARKEAKRADEPKAAPAAPEVPQKDVKPKAPADLDAKDSV